MDYTKTHHDPIAKCEFCNWTATLKGETDIVVASTFLRAKIMEHMQERHPEKLLQ